MAVIKQRFVSTLGTRVTDEKHEENTGDQQPEDGGKRPIYEDGTDHGNQQSSDDRFFQGGDDFRIGTTEETGLRFIFELRQGLSGFLHDGALLDQVFQLLNAVFVRHHINDEGKDDGNDYRHDLLECRPPFAA